MKAGAVVVAAGEGRRLGEGVPKAFVDLDGQCLLARAIHALQSASVLQELVLVVPGGEFDRARRLVLPAVQSGVRCQLVVGGRERQESVRNGLHAVPEDCEVVLIHDAARPFVATATVATCVRLAAEKGAVTAAIPATDTVKEADPDGRVIRTLDRSRLWLTQTPQAFRAALLREAHARAVAEGVSATDDAALVERCGGTVWVLPGDPANIKITTPDDLAWARWWLSRAQAPH